MFIEYMNEKRELAVKLNERVTNPKETFNAYYPEDFTCKCGCGLKMPGHFWINFMNYLYAQTKKYYIVTSGIRCEKYNKKIGGKDYYAGDVHKLSDHVLGMAIDVDYATLDGRADISYWASNFGIQRQIVYCGKKTFIHLSTNKDLSNPLLIFNHNGEIV